MTTYSNKQVILPETVDIWEGDFLRLFISHRDPHKKVANELASCLEPFGISSFVAHDVIQPTREWQEEIIKGLQTMEVMLVLLTDDFHKSNWTNQEIGFALGKGIPIVCLKVGTTDPQGFISSKQALKGNYENIYQNALDVHRTIMKHIGHEDRLKAVLM